MGKFPIVLAFILSLTALFWCWRSFEQSRSLAGEYQSKLARCKSTMHQIESLRSQNEDGFQVVKNDFDPISVSQALSNAGLETVSIDHSPGQKIDDTNFREWIVSVPSTSLTLKQAVDFIENLAESDENYQVNSLTLSRLKKENDSRDEKWSAQFDIRFLRSASN